MMSGHLGEIKWRPLVYVLQPDKYQETYEDTFQALADYMEEQQLRWRRGFRMNTDWELAERNAWRNVLEEDLDGCLFHFGKNLIL